MQDKAEERYLSDYRIDKYERPSVAVDIAAFSISYDEAANYKCDSRQRLSLLLIKRGEHPYKDMWALPGGFLRKGETLEECALREIQAECGITPRALMPAGVFSRPDRDPRGWIISNAFVSVIGGERASAVSGDDAADARWFDFAYRKEDEMLYLDMIGGDTAIHSVLKQKTVRLGMAEYEIVDSGGLSFDHAGIIAATLDRLRGVADNFDILFDFLPELFTISDLQRVYEAILNTSLASPNFRRKVMPYIEETKEQATGAGHRPAMLYRKKQTEMA